MTERDEKIKHLSGRNSLEKLVRRAIDRHGMADGCVRVICGLSGGADSVALLKVMLELSSEYGFEVAAAHLNHMLRGEESERDCEYAKRLCKRLGAPIYCEAYNAKEYAARHKMGIEQGARQLRYEFFERAAEALCADRIATAHTADDNLETVIFNLTRGAGLTGLCGIPPVRGRIIRPLIYCGRADVLEYLDKNGIEFCEDSSNFSRDYTRNRIRLDIIPVLKTINPNAEKTVAANSDMLREDAALLAELAGRAFEQSGADCGSIDIAEFDKMPRALESRLLAQMHGRFSDNGAGLSAMHIERICEFAADKAQNKRLSLPGNVNITKSAGRLKMSRKNECGSDGHNQGQIIEKRINIPGITELKDAGIIIKCEILDRKSEDDKESEKKANTFYIDCDKINEPIAARSRRAGDKLCIYPRNVTKTVKKLMNEKRIPTEQRQLLPVIADSKGVIAAYKLGLNAEYAAGTCAKCLKISFLHGQEKSAD